MSWADATKMLALTPEHDERVRRVARETGRTPEQVLADAVQEYWVRYATRLKLGADQW